MLDIAGERYGRLTARWPVGRSIRRGVVWLCSCECGNLKVVSGMGLRQGATKSCGCLHREQLVGKRGLHFRHGRSNTSIYNIWSGILQRCENPKNQAYKNYGARGIRVCERWKQFENFLADMGERPEGKTLDRINNDGNYEPSNCRWATWHEQRVNSRPRRGWHKSKKEIK